MKWWFVLVLGVAGTPAFAQDNDIRSRIDVLTYYQLYETCLKSQAAVDGAFSHTSPKAVAEGARSKCSETWNYFQNSFFGGNIPTQKQKEMLEVFRNNADGEASEEVVVMREGSCGTQSRKLHC